MHCCGSHGHQGLGGGQEGGRGARCGALNDLLDAEEPEGVAGVRGRQPGVGQHLGKFMGHQRAQQDLMPLQQPCAVLQAVEVQVRVHACTASGQRVSTAAGRGLMRVDCVPEGVLLPSNLLKQRSAPMPAGA